MSDSANVDDEVPKRIPSNSYGRRHPIPTTQDYQARKAERQADHEAFASDTVEANPSPKSTKSKRRSLLSSAKGLLRRDSTKYVLKGTGAIEDEPYRAENRNISSPIVRKDWAEVRDVSSPREENVEEKGLSPDEARQEDRPAASADNDALQEMLHTESQGMQLEQHHEPTIKDTASPEVTTLPEDTTSLEDAESIKNVTSPKDTDLPLLEGQENSTGPTVDGEKDESTDYNNVSTLPETSQAVVNALDPRQKRKDMKHRSRDNTDREVTDPVTHLSVEVHDFTDKELEEVPETESLLGSEPCTPKGFGDRTKFLPEIERDNGGQQSERRAMENLFPPPSFDVARDIIAGLYGRALMIGLVFAFLVPLVLLMSVQLITHPRDYGWPLTRQILMYSLLLSLGLLSGGSTILILRGRLNNQIKGVWDDLIWEAARKQEFETSDSSTPESVQWLNSLLNRVWGLINPDLFASVVDTLEDVMQASLPGFVRMISVEDLGQGNEAIRILGVRWLPGGAAAQNVSQDGIIGSNTTLSNDRKVAEEGQIGNASSNADTSSSNQEEQGPNHDPKREDKDEDKKVAEGMEAEQGDFVNMEVAFAYRASNSSKNLHDKLKNAHLYLAFYLPGRLKIPFWVEFRGAIGIIRIRLQLCPDPPFFALCTLTLLGQPKVDISCVPLTKKGLNIMDIPLISSFVQTSIDAALAEYVAPKSLTIDLKDMVVGDDFKKDTVSRGIIMVRIRQGREFKCGDSRLMGFKQGSSDAYVAVGWAKFGKPVWCTRVIVDEMHPVWEETAFLLVGPDELNAKERLRVQLWDSDKMSADDDLGRIELDLGEIMGNPNSKGKMCDRTDGFKALNDGEIMPGTLDWSVGYFAKQRVQPEQLEKQKMEPGIHSISELVQKVSEDANRKLREATNRDESREIDQQKAQDLKIREDVIIAATPPLQGYPTGIFSIQVHNITGLQLRKINMNDANHSEDDDAEGSSDDLPSSYCSIILNHQKIFKTRTKPKNAKPFFNAGTERLIRDWRTTEVMVSVRDSRIHENDALLGLVYLPLGKILAERSQVMDSYPLVGGIGYGRMRISMVFRSITLALPRQLLGWEYGTARITGPITSTDLSSELKGLRIKLHTTVNRRKMYYSSSGNGIRWTAKNDRSVCLAICKRYRSCLVLEFRQNKMGLDKTLAFGVFWLQEIPDEEEITINLPVWRMEKQNLTRGTSNVVQDLGERVGTLDIPLKFYRGLGVYHEKIARRSPDLQDVFEVLSTANDSQEVHTAIRDGQVDDSDSQSDSSDDSKTESFGQEDKSNSFLKKVGLERDNSNDHVDDGKGGPIKQLQNYKSHSNQLHRDHRGLMQWKGARTADFLKTELEHSKDHIVNKFKHHERDPGIETEV